MNSLHDLLDALGRVRSNGHHPLLIIASRALWDDMRKHLPSAMCDAEGEPTAHSTFQDVPFHVSRYGHFRSFIIYDNANGPTSSAF